MKKALTLLLLVVFIVPLSFGQNFENQNGNNKILKEFLEKMKDGSLPYGFNSSDILVNYQLPMDKGVQTLTLDSTKSTSLDIFTNEEESSKDEYIYNEDAINVEAFTYELDSLTQQWKYSEKSNYFYAADNQILQDSICTWDTLLNDWKTSDKAEYVYNKYLFYSERTESKWEEELEEWKYDYNTLFTFDGDNNITERLEKIWENDQWENMQKMENTIENGQVSVSIESEWIETEWKNQQKQEYVYDTEGKLSEMHTFDWDAENETWTEQLKLFYTYNDNDDPSLIMMSYQFQGIWLEMGKQEFTYDEDYNFDELVIPYIDEQDAVYDFHKMITDIKFQFKDLGTGQWKVVNHFEFFYSLHDYNNIVENRTNNVKVFPNPTTDIITISVPDYQDDIRFSLIDIQGRELFNQTINNNKSINVSEFESGVYFYQLSLKDKNVFGKIVIE